jgi:hypothetical protein
VATIDEITKEANKIDWFLVALCQYGGKARPVFRATFQRRTANGATETIFNSYEDAPDALTAVSNAFKQCKSMAKALNLPKPGHALPYELEKALCIAADDNLSARKKSGAPGRTYRKGHL